MNCLECGKEFEKKSNNQKFCSYECRYKSLTVRGVYRKNSLRRHYELHPNAGTGSGSQTGSGVKNHWYKNGIGLFNVYSPRIKFALGWCNRCGKYLRYAKKGEYAVHHRDHDRTNNKFNNFELLCITCHNQHHICGERSTTIREE